MPSRSGELPSRPGELHPEPLTDPDLTLSRHPARATARRLPRLPLNIGFLPLPVDPISKAMTCPLRSMGITPLHHYSPPSLIMTGISESLLRQGSDGGDSWPGKRLPSRNTWSGSTRRNAIDSGKRSAQLLTK